MFCHALIELRTDGADRTEGAACVLKDHAELRTVEPAKLRRRELRKIFTLIPDVSPCDQSGGAEQPHGRLDESGFSGTAFTDDAENLAFIDGKTDVPDGREAVIGNIDVIVT